MIQATQIVTHLLHQHSKEEEEEEKNIIRVSLIIINVLHHYHLILLYNLYPLALATDWKYKKPYNLKQWAMTTRRMFVIISHEMSESIKTNFSMSLLRDCNFWILVGHDLLYVL